MLELWSPSRRYGLWRRLWLALAEGERSLGVVIPDEALAQMRAHLDDIDFDAVAKYEKEFRHDVMAHVYAFGDVAPAARPFIHLGATSAYVTDNADLILMREGLSALREKVVARPGRPGRVRQALESGADVRLHAPAIGPAHDGRQAGDPVDAGPGARPGRPRRPGGRVAVTRRKGHDRNAGVIPRDVPRIARQCTGARTVRVPGHGIRQRPPGDRPDVFTEDRRPGPGYRGGHRDVSGQVRQRHPHAAVVRGTERTVRVRADRLLRDGVQAQSHAVGAHQFAGALRWRARAQCEPDARGAVFRAHTGRQREPPTGNSRSLPGNRRDPPAHGKRGQWPRSAPSANPTSTHGRTALHGDGTTHRSRRRGRVATGKPSTKSSGATASRPHRR